jgi:hypothetical protein
LQTNEAILPILPGQEEPAPVVPMMPIEDKELLNFIAEMIAECILRNHE